MLVPSFAPASAQQRVALRPDATAFAASIPDTGRIAFRVMRDDVDIGSHELVFRRDGERLDVDIAIDLKVTFLGVALYRYSHRARETWQNGRLIALESATDDNGTPYKIVGRGNEAGFAVSVGGKESVFPADALPSSHWNPAWLDGKPLINTQKGEKIDFTVADRGEETVATASGSLPARRFAIAGDLRKDIWFDAAGRWVKTRFDAPDGSSIFYVLQ
jgi:hypothetical protein